MTDSTHVPPAEAGAVAKRILDNMADERGRRRVRQAARDVVAGRDYQQLAKLKLNRAIVTLADEGVTQRDIAEMVGISQPEVSRRLKRRELHAPQPGPREIVLQRLAGELSSKEMIKKLTEMPLTTGTPGKMGAYDGAACAMGSKKQLMEVLREGLLTEDEYETVREARIGRQRT